MSTNSRSKIFFVNFGGSDPDGNWEKLTAVSVGATFAIADPGATIGSGADSSGAADTWLALRPPIENVGITGKEAGSGNMPIQGVAEGVGGGGGGQSSILPSAEDSMTSVLQTCIEPYGRGRAGAMLV